MGYREVIMTWDETSICEAWKLEWTCNFDNIGIPHDLSLFHMTKESTYMNSARLFDLGDECRTKRTQKVLSQTQRQDRWQQSWPYFRRPFLTN
jgi:hypothetical protein